MREIVGLVLIGLIAVVVALGWYWGSNLARKV
jgi:hypothetical protein